VENRWILWKTALAVSLLTLVPNIHAQSKGSVSTRVLAYFEQIGRAQRLEDYLKHTRPKPVSLAVKGKAIANLPPNAEVQPSEKGRAKLAALATILEFHDRSGIIDLKVIGDKQYVFIGLYEQCALIITEKALDLLSKEELQAVVAHELAHELFWDEYRLAREGNQDDKVQEIELRCDGIAICTLVRLGLNPKPLISAVQKTTPNSQDTWGTHYYAPRNERLSFARRMINRAKQADLNILASGKNR